MKAGKKYSLDYWVKQNRSWDTESDLLEAIKTYSAELTHPQIEFTGTTIDFAFALYASWRKRGGGKWMDGFFPTPIPVANEMADLLDLNEADVVLDPGSGFGNLSFAVMGHQATPVPAEFVTWLNRVSEFTLPGIKTIDTDFISGEGGELPKFNKVIVNPPFGNCYNHPSIEVDFMDRIGRMSSPGTLVSAILPTSFFTKQQNKYRVAAEKFGVLKTISLSPETFKPMTSVATNLHLLKVL